jgi:serpin B
MLARFQGYGVTLTMPRFSIDTRFNLSDTLKAMGMPTAFNSLSADFTGMTTKEPIHIGNVIHQANIDVVEEGTTAAAVTVVNMEAGAAPPGASVTFHIDKPFLYLIRDSSSGAILFMGRVNDPSTTK